MEFLLEVGCEEIPARFLPPALEGLAGGFRAGLEAARLAGPELEVHSLGTPRRLVLRARGLPASQPDLDEEIAGPKVAVAYDRDGKPTATCLGFAKSRGVDVSALVRIDTPKGEVVAVRRRVAGRPTGEVL
ncbi:MAG TPA: glycine--tRNA ligase subunit beta, partial [Myxococcota bacterium]|nr:glycine--tRNA ligase subunit beta [Myxococcota bacterium]